MWCPVFPPIYSALLLLGSTTLSLLLSINLFVLSPSTTSSVFTRVLYLYHLQSKYFVDRYRYRIMYCNGDTRRCISKAESGAAVHPTPHPHNDMNDPTGILWYCTLLNALGLVQEDLD